MRVHRHESIPGLLRLSVAAALLLLGSLACGDDDAASEATPTPFDDTELPSPAGTPAPPDPDLARSVFSQFVDAVQDGALETAWSLYAGNATDEDEEQDPALGCEEFVFAGEFEQMQHMFERIAPLTVNEVFGNATGSLRIELTLTGADGNSYLATLVREPPSADYRMRFFNIGRAALQPGVPDPFPSPEDPRGFCGIWTGPR